jgi:hypothetical protein
MTHMLDEANVPPGPLDSPHAMQQCRLSGQLFAIAAYYLASQKHGPSTDDGT